MEKIESKKPHTVQVDENLWQGLKVAAAHKNVTLWSLVSTYLKVGLANDKELKNLNKDYFNVIGD